MPHAMGPGIMGQLVEMAANDRAQHQSCLRCHAPLSEQADALVTELSKGTYDHKAMPQTATSKKLHERGMICAACHVRNYQWYGPPRKDGTFVETSATTIAHAAWTAVDAFADSRFCSSCHQFAANGFALNGKLLENTYEEWKASPYPEQGISCQNCHMPERRHLWRGIHDPDMTRSGVTIETSAIRIEQGRIKATIKITNSNTGHYFPSYITPKVLLQGIQLDPSGKTIDSSVRQSTIGRDLPLNLAVENYDTRLAPDQIMEMNYDEEKAAAARIFLLKIVVQPDEFYTRFYKSLLNNGFTNKGGEMIEQALLNSTDSIYTLFEKRYPLE